MSGFFEAFVTARALSQAEAARQKRIYDSKTSAVSLHPGDWVLVKADTYQGKRKVKDRWDSEPYEVVERLAPDHPSYVVRNKEGKTRILHRNRLLLLASEEERGVPVLMMVAIADPSDPGEDKPKLVEVTDAPPAENQSALSNDALSTEARAQASGPSLKQMGSVLTLRSFSLMLQDPAKGLET